MSPLPNNIETAIPPVMNRTTLKNTCFLTLQTRTCPCNVFYWFHPMRHYSDVSFTSLLGLFTADVCMYTLCTLVQTLMCFTRNISGQLHWRPMLMRDIGCLALHKMHAYLHKMHTRRCLIKTQQAFLHEPAKLCF